MTNRRKDLSVVREVVAFAVTADRATGTAASLDRDGWPPVAGSALIADASKWLHVDGSQASGFADGRVGVLDNRSDGLTKHRIRHHGMNCDRKRVAQVSAGDIARLVPEARHSAKIVHLDDAGAGRSTRSDDQRAVGARSLAVPPAPRSVLAPVAGQTPASPCARQAPGGPKKGPRQVPRPSD